MSEIGQLRNAAKALRYIDRISQFVTDLEAGKGINILPVHAELDITSLCNMSCRWCRNFDTKYSKRRPGNMQLSVVSQTSAIVKAISLKGGGEPTLHPEFETICEVIHANGISLGMTTNGTVSIKHPEYFAWIKISMDVWDSESLKRLKGFYPLDIIIQNAKEWSQKTEVGMSFLRHEGIKYDKCIELARHAGVQYCVFREVLGYPNEDVPKWLIPGMIDKLSVQIAQMPNLRQDLGCWGNCLLLHIGPDCGLNLCCWTKFQRIPYAFVSDKHSVLDCWRSAEHVSRAIEYLHNTQNCFACRFQLYQEAIVESTRFSQQQLELATTDEDFV